MKVGRQLGMRGKGKRDGTENKEAKKKGGKQNTTDNGKNDAEKRTAEKKQETGTRGTEENQKGKDAKKGTDVQKDRRESREKIWKDDCRRRKENYYGSRDKGNNQKRGERGRATKRWKHREMKGKKGGKIYTVRGSRRSGGEEAAYTEEDRKKRNIS